MTANKTTTKDARSPRKGVQTRRRDHDVVTLGIAFAAIILFVGTAGVVLPNLIEAWTGDNPSPDSALTNALLLNIALILLGWHRYKALTEELNSRRESEEEARRLADIASDMRLAAEAGVPSAEPAMLDGEKPEPDDGDEGGDGMPPRKRPRAELGVIPNQLVSV